MSAELKRAIIGMAGRVWRSRFVTVIKTYAAAHKAIAAVVLALAVFGGYRAYTALTSTAGETQYVTTAAAKGTIVVSVTGSGQVSVLNQVDIKPKVSGDVVYVGVKNGQEVRQGALIAQLDTSDAVQAVNDAQVSLDQANLTLEKMKGLTTDEGTIRGDKEKAADELAKSYDDGFNSASNAFLDLPGIVTGLHDIMYASSFGTAGQWNIDYYVNGVQNALGQYSSEAYAFRNTADAAYRAAREAYDKNFSDYKATSRLSSDNQTIESMIDQTYDTTKLIAEAVKSTNNLIQFYKDRLTEYNVKPNALADTHLSQLSAYTGKTNTHLSNLLSIRDTIRSNKETIVNTGFNISDQKIQVAKAENALADAKQKLAECFIRAPFTGVIAKVNVKKGETVSSGTAVATIITAQHIAKLTLNEVDAAKVKLGQKVTLTFDAVPDASAVGEVADIDTLGTVSQGVVSYAVEIAFSVDDARVKPGMSVSAAIVTDVKQDVLTVPVSAVKSRGDASYVGVFDGMVPSVANGQSFPSAVPPREQAVETGISNDTETEIVSGLKEGDLVVVRETSATASQTQTVQGVGGIRIPGIGGGGR
ncbi:MAG: efflux RND transporter periplasmic adaptor subunit [Candidatus Jorgensenbacteria bacterium]